MRRKARGYLQVAAADREVEARARLCDEVQGNIFEAVLLQVGDDGVRVDLGGADDANSLAVVLLLQVVLLLTTAACTHFEQVLRRVHLELHHHRVAREGEHAALAEGGDVHGLVQTAHDAALAGGQAVLDLRQRGVQQHAVLVPQAALHAHLLGHRAQLHQLLVQHAHRVSVAHRHHRVVGAPAHALHHGNGDVAHHLQRRGVEQHQLVLAGQQHTAAHAAGEDAPAGSDGERQTLGDLGVSERTRRDDVVHVAKEEGVLALQRGELGAGHEADAQTRTALELR